MNRPVFSASATLRAIAASGLLAAALLSSRGALATPHSREAAASPPRVAPEAAHPAVPLRVEDAWIPQPPPGAEVAAAYFTLLNAGSKPAVLVGIDCPAAAAAMLHVTSVVHGQSRMRPVDRLTVAPGQSVMLKPRGLHVMLHGLTSALEVGQQVPLVLHFAGGAELRISARVRPLGSQ